MQSFNENVVLHCRNLASHAPADDAASAPAEQSSIEGVLGVARHLTREVGAHGTSAQTASQLLRTLALTCHEWSSGMCCSPRVLSPELFPNGKTSSATHCLCMCFNI